ncbi:ABC transporter permease [Candidatus Saccharibacteria bacterium]|nr:ABC transporter permease [Candidatus Saccharibacteria bacterium]
MIGTSHRRIRALVLQELYLTRHSVEIFFDTLFFPLMSVILFGLIMHFFGQVEQSTNAQYLLIGILLWQIISVSQYNITVSSLWSVWSHNLTNIFIAPISVKEYISAHIIASFIRTFSIFIFLAGGTYLLFDFSILNIGILNFIFAFINLSLFAWWLGYILLGYIFRYGTRIQAIAWGAIFLFQPLTASFFPVSTLPGWLQTVAYALPPTYVFESARKSIVTPGIYWNYVVIALAMNVAYSIFGLFIFKRLFRRSKETGQFARNDL